MKYTPSTPAAARDRLNDITATTGIMRGKQGAGAFQKLSWRLALGQIFQARKVPDLEEESPTHHVIALSINPSLNFAPGSLSPSHGRGNERWNIWSRIKSTNPWAMRGQNGTKLIPGEGKNYSDLPQAYASCPDVCKDKTWVSPNVLADDGLEGTTTGPRPGDRRIQCNPALDQSASSLLTQVLP